MKRIFKKGKNHDRGGGQNDQNNFRARSLSNPLDNFSSDILHDASKTSENNPTNGRNDVLGDLVDISRTTSLSTESKGLSDSETLYYDKEQRTQLQDTYDENFSVYLPYIIRQLAIESQNHEVPPDSHVSTSDSDTRMDSPMDHSDNETQETQSTVVDVPISGSGPSTGVKILQKPTRSFSVKRKLIIANEFMKNNTYVFPSEESFKLFKVLKSNIKKERKNNLILYDNSGTIRRLSNVKAEDLPLSEGTVDNRTHIIPVSYKVKGMGLPLFKIHVPYLSSFRKNSPFMVFKRFKEIPPAPCIQDSEDSKNDEQDETFEQYTFSTVHVKHHREVKRFLFNFYPGKRNSFRVLLFQNNYKPFSDFIYKETRFRIMGTAMVSGYPLPYNPELKLMIIDNNKEGLCDSIINKKPTFEFSSIIRKRRKSVENIKPTTSYDSNISVEFDEDDPTTYPNPHPDFSAPMFRDKYFVNPRSYSCDKLPPFGMFKDYTLYLKDDFGIIPKKFKELGRLEVYQDGSTISSESPDSTLSFDDDTMVLSIIMLTMREVNIRNSARASHGKATPIDIGRANSLGGSLLLA